MVLIQTTIVFRFCPGTFQDAPPRSAKDREIWFLLYHFIGNLSRAPASLKSGESYGSSWPHFQSAPRAANFTRNGCGGYSSHAGYPSCGVLTGSWYIVMH